MYSSVVLSIFRFSSCKTEILYPLNNNSSISPSLSLWQPLFSFLFLLICLFHIGSLLWPEAFVTFVCCSIFSSVACLLTLLIVSFDEPNYECFHFMVSTFLSFWWSIFYLCTQQEDILLLVFQKFFSFSILFGFKISLELIFLNVFSPSMAHGYWKVYLFSTVLQNHLCCNFSVCVCVFISGLVGSVGPCFYTCTKTSV